MDLFKDPFLSSVCVRFRAGCCSRVLLLERCVCFGGGLLVPLQGAAAGCSFSVLLLERCVRFGAGPLQGAAAGQQLVSEWCARFGAGLLVPLCRVPLQGAASGAAVRVVCVAAVAGCRCWVPCALWNWLAGAATGCGCRVLLSKEGCLHLRNLGAATGHCCQSAVCAVKLGWCRLQVVAARCLRQCGHWPLMEIMFML